MALKDVWLLIKSHWTAHQTAKREAAELQQLREKIDANYQYFRQMEAGILHRITQAEKLYYGKGVMIAGFHSLEDRTKARINGLEPHEKIAAITDTNDQYRAKTTYLSHIQALRGYADQMQFINRQHGSAPKQESKQ